MRGMGWGVRQAHANEGGNNRHVASTSSTGSQHASTYLPMRSRSAGWSLRTGSLATPTCSTPKAEATRA